MCIVFCKSDSSSSSSKLVLVLAANRDEFLARPSAPLDWHPANTSKDNAILSGLDLQSGGTWIGISRLPQGRGIRFASLTNFTEQVDKSSKKPSRGELVHDFLDMSKNEPGSSIEAFLERVDQTKDEYAGFNLLVGAVSTSKDDQPVTVGYVSNRNNKQGHIVDDHTLHGAAMSNSTLDDLAWPKVKNGKRAFVQVLQATQTRDESDDVLVGSLFDMLSQSSAKPVKDRMSLRNTVLVRPLFFDPYAPLPPTSFATSNATTETGNGEIDTDPKRPDDVGPFEQKEGEKGGHWYATRAQTVLIVSRDVETGSLQVEMRERDAYRLDDQTGKPVWSGKQRALTFTVP